MKFNLIGGRREKEPPTKKKRLDTAGEWLDAETEELEVYGVSQEATHHKISAFTFEVRYQQTASERGSVARFFYLCIFNS